MFTITDYALPAEVAEDVADEVREYIRSAAQAWEKVKILRAELMVRAPAHPARLFGTGMILVNPPFTLDAELKLLLPELAKILADNGRGGTQVDWIRGE